MKHKMQPVRITYSLFPTDNCLSEYIKERGKLGYYKVKREYILHKIKYKFIKSGEVFVKKPNKKVIF